MVKKFSEKDGKLREGGAVDNFTLVDVLFTNETMNGFLHFKEGTLVGLSSVGRVEKSYHFWRNFLIDFLKISFYEKIDSQGVYAITGFRESNRKRGTKFDGLFVVKSEKSELHWEGEGSFFYSTEDFPIVKSESFIAIMVVDETFTGELFGTIIPINGDLFPSATNFSTQKNIMVQIDNQSGTPKPDSGLDWKCYVHYSTLQN